MPLPTPGSAWPPPALKPALQRMETWEAWWSGDVDVLAAHYGSGGVGHPFFRPSQYAGGVVGAMSRMWWGRPSAPHEPPAKLHVPLAGDICRASASLLFSEPISAASDDANVTAALDELLDEGMQAKLLEAAEIQAAMGGVYLRPVYDPEISDRAWLDAIAPDSAIPEWRWGRLSAVMFWRVVREDDADRVWRHFERHEPGRIVHALYMGRGDDIGRPVPLDDVEATAGFAPLVDEDGSITTGYEWLAASYIPNMLPNRRWRKQPLLAPMGRSDLDGIEGTLDALDETYSSWMRDVRLAKGRIIVGDSMLDDQGPGRGAVFDPDREAYSVARGIMPKDAPMTVAQFEIRTQQHHDTAHELAAIALRHAGYAGITLGEDTAGPAITATEVKSKGQLSFVTRDRKVGYWRPQLAQNALPALLAIDAFVFKRTGLDLSKPLNVEFADSVAEDMSSIAATVKTLSEAKAVSIETGVRMVHPEWDEPQVAAEVAKIRDDSGPALASPFDYGDGAPGSETDDQRAALDEDDEPVEDEELSGVRA